MSKHCLRCQNNSFEIFPYLQKGTPPTCGRECLCSREPRTWPWLVDDLHIGAGGILPLVCPCSRTAAASYTSSSSAPQWWSLLTLPAFKIISKQSHMHWTKKSFNSKWSGSKSILVNMVIDITYITSWAVLVIVWSTGIHLRVDAAFGLRMCSW